MSPRETQAESLTKRLLAIKPVRSTMANYWNGATVQCDCGSENVEYVKDVDHDMGTCEVFKCQDCGKSIHNELPD